MTASFTRLATATLTTRRPPAVSAGKRGEPVPHLGPTRCTPAMPVDPETRLALGLRAPLEVWQIFVEGAPDIREGDLVELDGRRTYKVRAVAAWPGRHGYVRLLVDEVKV